MRGLMIFANGFEDVEGIATVDVLRRGRVDVECVSFEEDRLVHASWGSDITYPKSLSEVDYTKYDFLILPGGGAVYKTLVNSKKIDEIVCYFASNNKLVCAICAAPALIGKHGFFKGHTFTCFPQCDGIVTEGTNTHEEVVHSGNFITARSMYYACEFALEIIATIRGKDVAKQVENSIKGL